jgi:hypothetical protein
MIELSINPFIFSMLQAFLLSFLLFSYYNYNVVFPTSVPRINGNAFLILVVRFADAGALYAVRVARRGRHINLDLR